jgi:hypothetical protein
VVVHEKDAWRWLLCCFVQCNAIVTDRVPSRPLECTSGTRGRFETDDGAARIGRNRGAVAGNREVRPERDQTGVDRRDAPAAGMPVAVAPVRQ